MPKPVSTTGAPRAIGPYSQGVEAPAGRAVWCSGQIPLDPATGDLVAGDAAVQTERVLENLRAVLAAAGAALEDVVKVTIFLVDLGDFAKVNEVYARYFTGAPPARSTVQVAALPRGARVEIDCVAVP